MMTSAAAVGAGLDSRYYFFFLFLIYGTATDIVAGSRTDTLAPKRSAIAMKIMKGCGGRITYRFIVWSTMSWFIL